MKMADRQDAFVHVRDLLRIRLVKQTFIAAARRAGLARVDARNDHQFSGHALVYFRKARDVVQNGIRPVRGAGPDDHEEAVIPSVNDPAHRLVVLRFLRAEGGRQCKLLSGLSRGRHLIDILETHKNSRRAERVRSARNDALSYHSSGYLNIFDFICLPACYRGPFRA